MKYAKTNLIILSILAIFASPATATGPYWITDLGILPGGYDASWAFSLNNTGQVVGVSYDEETNTARGFIWDNGVMTDLGELLGVNYYIVPWSINDKGQVVGFRYTSQGDHAFLWENGEMKELGEN